MNIEIEPDAIPRRDDKGRYLANLGDGYNPYPRVSNIISVFGGAPPNYDAVGTLKGATPETLEHVAEADGNWRKLVAIAQGCQEAGGNNVKRDRGSNIHTAVEELLKGLPATTEYEEDARRILAALDDAGYDPLPEYSERYIVCASTTPQYAGTFDLIVRRRSDGRLFLCDLKTGTVYPIKLAAQLAAYLYGDIYNYGDATDGSEDSTEDWPDNLDNDVGLVIAYDWETKATVIKTVDLLRGRDLLSLALQVRAASSKGICKQIHKFSDTTAAESTVAPSVKEGASSDVAAPGVAVVSDPRDGWLIDRCIEIIEAGHVATLKTYWPEDVAPPKHVEAAKAEWSDIDREHIIEILRHVEALHEMPFAPLDPATPHHEPRTTPPAPTPHVYKLRGADDGKTVDEKDAEILRNKLGKQGDDNDARFTLTRWAREARENGVSFRIPKGEPVAARNFEICRAVYWLLENVYDYGTNSDDLCRHLLSEVIGDDAHQPTLAFGALLGTLTTAEATQLCGLAQSDLTIGDDGKPQVAA